MTDNNTPSEQGVGGSDIAQIHRCPARDGDEQEGKQTARPDWAGAIDELSDSRHLQVGMDDDNADC